MDKKNYIKKSNFNTRKIFEIQFSHLIILKFSFFLAFVITYLKLKYQGAGKNELIEKFYDILPKVDINSKIKIHSLNQIFNSRQIFIDNSSITKEYIHFIRPIDEKTEEKYTMKLYEGLIPNNTYKILRPNQYNLSAFFQLCYEEKLIDSGDINYDNNPLVSIVLISFNKEKIF